LAVGAAVSRSGGCVRLAAAGSGMVADFVVPATGLELTTSAGGAGRASPTLVMLKRFASVYAPPPAATLKDNASIVVKPVKDADPRPWQVRAISHQVVRACTLAGA
jgi:hypothetical protein